MQPIQLSELRLGNLGQSNTWGTNDIYQWTWVDQGCNAFSWRKMTNLQDDYGLICSAALEDVQGIPVTIELLAKIGFSNNKGISVEPLCCWIPNEPFEIVNFGEGEGWRYRTAHLISRGQEIKFLHEMQNLYWIMLGKELDVTSLLLSSNI